MKHNGFTLIEILVVVGIIGMLSIMSITGFSQQQRRARDARRIADIGAVGLAIESYFGAHNSYPSDNSAGVDGKRIDQNLTVLATEGLINNLPVDPKVTGQGTEQFCSTYTYKNSWFSTSSSLYQQLDRLGDNTLNQNATFNGVAVGPRRWVLYMATEVTAPADLHHPLDNTIPATSSASWCGNQRGYAWLLGPLQ